MKKKKQVIFRVKKVAPKRYLVEQRRRFLFWHFWQKGCPALGIKKFYANKQVAKTAIYSRSERMNILPVVIFK